MGTGRHGSVKIIQGSAPCSNKQIGGRQLSAALLKYQLAVCQPVRNGLGANSFEPALRRSYSAIN